MLGFTSCALVDWGKLQARVYRTRLMGGIVMMANYVLEKLKLLLAEQYRVLVKLCRSADV